MTAPRLDASGVGIIHAAVALHLEPDSADTEDVEDADRKAGLCRLDIRAGTPATKAATTVARGGN